MKTREQLEAELELALADNAALTATTREVSNWLKAEIEAWGREEAMEAAETGAYSQGVCSETLFTWGQVKRVLAVADQPHPGEGYRERVRREALEEAAKVCEQNKYPATAEEILDLASPEGGT